MTDRKVHSTELLEDENKRLKLELLRIKIQDGKIDTDDLSLSEKTILAKVGVTALVDECTGYQNHRPKDDLRMFLKDLI